MSIEQAVRKSHCSLAHQADGNLKCAGVLTISDDQYKLNCAICGTYSQETGGKTQWEDIKPYVSIAKDMFDATGVHWNSLSSEAQADAVNNLRTKSCPSCGRLGLQRDKYFTCSCGKTAWDPYRNWIANKE